MCADQVSPLCTRMFYPLCSMFQLFLFVLGNIPKSWKILYLFHK